MLLLSCFWFLQPFSSSLFSPPIAHSGLNNFQMSAADCRREILHNIGAHNNEQAGSSSHSSASFTHPWCVPSSLTAALERAPPPPQVRVVIFDEFYSSIDANAAIKLRLFQQLCLISLTLIIQYKPIHICTYNTYV